MDEKPQQGTAVGEEQPLDLSELEGMSLGPSWSDERNITPTVNISHRDREKPSRPVKAAGSRRDRRARLPQRTEKRIDSRVPFKPNVEVTFYPEDMAFRKLVKAIRASGKTYELFDITRLILEKPERVVAMVRPLSSENNKSRRLYIALADDLPFESEEEAFDYSIDKYLDRFFKIETVDVEPPKGTFAIVNRCSITGELLGPPNYHRYQELIEQHHAAQLPHIAFETFVSKIEAVKDPEVIEDWLKKMSQQTRYILKGTHSNESTPEIFDSAKSVRRYLLDNKLKSIVKIVSSARVSGSIYSKLLAKSNIKQSIDYYLEAQRRFPLESANHLRGRLRRLKIDVYKKGSRGISFICAVKRKFREQGQLLADSVQELIDFIEKNPQIKVSQLQESFLEIKKEIPVVGSADNAENAAQASGDESSQNKEKLHLMHQNLHWLITEGYVVEYGDGTLYAPAPRPQGNKSSIQKSDKVIKADSEESMELKPSREKMESIESTTDDANVSPGSLSTTVTQTVVGDKIETKMRENEEEEEVSVSLKSGEPKETKDGQEAVSSEAVESENPAEK